MKEMMYERYLDVTTDETNVGNGLSETRTIPTK